MVSRCCKEEVVAIIEYYICIRCGRPTDVMLRQSERKIEYHHDDDYDSETESG